MISTGNIGVVTKPKTFIGRLIWLFVGSSHTFNFVVENGIVWVYEMVGKGCIKTRFSETKYYKSDNWVLLELVLPVTPEKEIVFRDACERIYNMGTKYDPIALLRHAVFVLLDKYPVEKKDNKKYVCSEYTAICINAMFHFVFQLEQTISPKTVLTNKYLRVKKK